MVGLISCTVLFVCVAVLSFRVVHLAKDNAELEKANADMSRKLIESRQVNYRILVDRQDKSYVEVPKLHG
jgi:hypothetical protein